ncbi:hypothetical protein IV203_010341 [Nitzschia inconspicua]|uniref:Core-binding (CB) domain-containing protein n=1 Tax=Nitzschia inconspicua TaxID=303405 RepID=A0A9K3PLB6_9STRA|nr:hypothetical protein IV203_010341 [Nitzschia inconspicua]
MPDHADQDSNFDAEEAVGIVRTDTISQKSRDVYDGSIARMLKWFFDNKRHLLSEEFIQFGITHGFSKADIRRFLADAPSNAPVKFNDVNVQDFIEWIDSIRKEDGSTPTYSTYNSHRAGIFNLFRDYKQNIVPFQSELKAHFRGIQRTTTQASANGEGKAKSGKDALEFSLYKSLCLLLMKSAKPDYVFTHCFMTYCWNLMSRAGNMTSISWSHLEWRNDALRIFFTHRKNDQFGQRPRDPKHIYANPIIPEICPILSLGIYMLTTPISPTNTQLFPGGSQYDRFRKVLIRLLNTEEGSAELQARGMTTDDIGTDSCRSGAATYVLSGSTAAPPSTAVHLRAGWPLGGVQDRHLPNEAAGDQYVGRTVTGLPMTIPEFAILPPHFKKRSPLVDTMISTCFPNLPTSAVQVAEFALASIVWHVDFLEQTLPSNHRLFFTPLFRDREQLKELKNLVTCRLNSPGDAIVATGVPPHISILQHMELLAKNVNHVVPEIKKVAPNIIRGVIEEIEKRAMPAGTVTEDDLKAVIMSSLEKSGLPQLVQRLGNAPTPDVQQEETLTRDQAVTMTHSWGSHMWGGRLHFVPQDFAFPNGCSQIAWQYWMCGDPQKQYPPLRNLRKDDMPNTNLRKRLSDFRYLMQLIEERVEEKGKWIAHPSIEQANEMFEAGKDILDISDVSEKGRKRRGLQMKWSSMVTQVRNKRKSQRTL